MMDANAGAGTGVNAGANAGADAGARDANPAPLDLHLAVVRAGGVEVNLDNAWFERVAQAALAAAGIASAVEVALLLADDQTLRRLNRDYRGVDQPTDVLSFSQLEGAPAPASAPQARRHLGDVAISVERSRRQADAYGHGFEREIGYLLVHAVLHLVGSDHETDTGQAMMRAVEERALATVALTRDGRGGEAQP
jgi:probable rRNA maturation factor